MLYEDLFNISTKKISSESTKLTNKLYKYQWTCETPESFSNAVIVGPTNSDMYNYLFLWGKIENDKEYVKYTKLYVHDMIPIQLNNYCKHNNNFEFINGRYIAKYIGRYIINVNSNKWVLDVVFNNFAKTINNDIKEYINGETAVYPGWKYEIKDANMIEFVMQKVNMLPYNKRDIITVLRHLMSEFSSENSDTGLIEGKWGNKYKDGRSPNEWKSPSEIFYEWSLTNKPVKYGQCWIFSECLTICLRFLGIPTRTVFATNSHLNPKLDGYVDFFEDSSFMKNDDNQELNNIKRLSNVIDFLNSDNNKSDIFEDCDIYSSNDSIWNIHYWNECLITRDGKNYYWEMLDSCPFTKSNFEPFKNKSILGPCKIMSIKSNYRDKLYDYNFLHACVNSPFRVWIKETTILNGEIITIPYVHSIVYPFYPNSCTMTTSKNVKKILQKEINLTTRNVNGIINITENYKMRFDTLLHYLLETNPTIFYKQNSILLHEPEDDNNEYYVQQVIIDNKNTMCKIRRQKCKLTEIVPLEFISTDRILSVLIIRNNEYWVQLLDLN